MITSKYITHNYLKSLMLHWDHKLQIPRSCSFDIQHFFVQNVLRRTDTDTHNYKRNIPQNRVTNCATAVKLRIIASMSCMSYEQSNR